MLEGQKLSCIQAAYRAIEARERAGFLSDAAAGKKRADLGKSYNWFVDPLARAAHYDAAFRTTVLGSSMLTACA